MEYCDDDGEEDEDGQKYADSGGLGERWMHCLR